MAGVTVEIIGKDKLLGILNRMRVITAQLVRDAVSRSALAIQGGAKRLCPVDSGRLRSSIGVRFYLGGLAGHIGTNVEYAQPVEFGTGVYGPQQREIVIVPKRATVLSWIGKDGQRVFASKVVIKGQKPQPFLGPAFDDEMPRFERAIEKAIDDGLRSA